MPPPFDCPPKRITKPMEAFCASLRQGSMPIYSALLRENVLEVLRCSFPIFSQYMEADDLVSFAAGFIQSHAVQLPRFFEIATEAVRYAQSQKCLSTQFLCLMEYEWSLLAVEIDAAHVLPSGKTSITAERVKRGIAVEMNPTLRFVSLPFDVQQLNKADLYKDSGAQHIYALYRSSTHAVLVRPLTQLDCVLIEGIRRTGKVEPRMLETIFSNRDAGQVMMSWLNQGDDVVRLCE